MRRRIVIGIGNPDRGDDAAGRLVARQLRGKVPADVEIVEHDGETAALIAAFDGRASAFLVDACVAGAAPGTIHRVDLGREALPPSHPALSSHGIGLAQAVALADALGQLPPQCIAYAIEGACFDIGGGLSPPVADAVAEVVRRLHAEMCMKEAPRCTKPR
jgi:hydrogenase maturation protease